jgi:phosphohistidine swiveling domain-containing protein
MRSREYCIPALMGTRTGTRVLADRERVTVDGGAGRITAAREGC